MGYMALDVNVISAKGLKDVNLINKMDVYAVVSIFGDPQKQKFKTPVSHYGGSNPTWNCPINFAIDNSLAYHNRLSIVFKIKSKRILGDKDIGEVIVPVKELIDGKLPQFLDYQVRTPTGNSKGLLNFSYKFSDVFPAAAGIPYSPPMKNGGYPSPQQGYFYPPPRQQQQQAPKKNKLAWLIGGKLAGLLIGCMVPDMDENDMGGFDF